MALSIPARVSTIRVGSFPRRSSRVIDFVTNAPSLERSMKSAYSNAYPHVPEQVIVGLVSSSPESFIERSGTQAFYVGADAVCKLSRGKRVSRPLLTLWERRISFSL